MMAKLDEQINRLGLWAVLVVLITFVITLFLPLDAPGGLSATQVERVDWLQDNQSTFILGWINQLLAMMALTAVFLSTTWQIRRTNPLRALVAGLVTCASFIVFSRTKVHCHLEHPAIGTSHRNRCGEPRYGGRFAFDSECFITILALYGVRLLGLLAVRAFRFAHDGPAVRSFASG